MENTLGEMDLRDIYRTFHLISVRCTFISLFCMVDYIMWHKTNLSKFQIIFSMYETDNRKWQDPQICANWIMHLWITNRSEINQKENKTLSLNKCNENATYQFFLKKQHIKSCGVQEKHTEWKFNNNNHISKVRKASNKLLTFTAWGTREEQVKSKLSRRKEIIEIKDQNRNKWNGVQENNKKK